MITQLCMLVAITFYPRFVPEPWPLSQQWAILPNQRMVALHYALHNISSLVGEIERAWPVPWEYCMREGFDE